MYLYGASGHGLVIKDIVEALGGIVEGFVDDDISLENFASLPVAHSAVGLSPMIISIGSNVIRCRIANMLSCTFGTAVHPSAIVSPSATIGEGTVVMPGAIINANVHIGRHCIINTGASIDHECVIGDFVHVAPHATLCGQVCVGDGCLIGVGASVIPCRHIGEWCVVGAGAAVVNDVVSKTTVVGVPARILNDDKMINKIRNCEEQDCVKTASNCVLGGDN